MKCESKFDKTDKHKKGIVNQFRDRWSINLPIIILDVNLHRPDLTRNRQWTLFSCPELYRNYSQPFLTFAWINKLPHTRVEENIFLITADESRFGAMFHNVMNNLSYCCPTIKFIFIIKSFICGWFSLFCVCFNRTGDGDLSCPK